MNISTDQLSLRRSKGMLKYYVLAAIAACTLIAVPANADSGVCFKSNPLQSTAFFSNFGMRVHPFKLDNNGRPALKMHQGLDFKANYEALYAIDDGVVLDMKTFSDGIKAIYLMTNSGIEVRYEHADQMYVKRGAVVKAGELIGKSGASGAPQGPHLHFEVRANGGATLVDPKNYFCPSPAIAKAMQTTYYPGAPSNIPVPLVGTGGGGSTVVPKGGVPPSGTPDPNAPGGPSNGVPGGGTMAAKGGGIPSDAPFPDEFSSSTKEFFEGEIAKRFFDKNWIEGLANPFALYSDPLWISTHPAEAAKGVPIFNPELMILREIMIMMTLSHMIQQETEESRSSTQSMASTLLQIKAKGYSDTVLRILRNNLGTVHPK
jgi:hypothetical protein